MGVLGVGLVASLQAFEDLLTLVTEDLALSTSPRCNLALRRVFGEHHVEKKLNSVNGSFERPIAEPSE
jgi:hypothetical protein